MATIHPQQHQLQVILPSGEEKQSQVIRWSRSLSSKLATGFIVTGVGCAWEGFRYGLTSIVRTYSTDASYGSTAKWIENKLPVILKKDFEGVAPECEAMETTFYAMKGIVHYPFMAMTWLFPMFAKKDLDSDTILKNNKVDPEVPVEPLTPRDLKKLSQFKVLLEQSKRTSTTPPPKDTGYFSYFSDVTASFLEAVESVKQRTYTFLCHGGIAPDLQYMNQAMMYGLIAVALVASGYAIKQRIARSDEKEEHRKLECKYVELMTIINKECAQTHTEVPVEASSLEEPLAELPGKPSQEIRGG